MRLNRTLLAAIAGAAALAGASVWQASAADTVPISEVSHIHGIALDPTDPERLYLATHFGVWRTAPDGTATRISEAQDDFMGFTPHPQDPDVFLASGHPAQGGNLGFIRSEDAGVSWSQVSPGANGPVDFHAMDVSPADPNVVYGLYGNLQVSFDGGQSWRVKGAPPADVYDIAASARDAATVYAATSAGLMISRDAGASWEPAGSASQPASLVEVGEDGTVYAFVVGQGLLRATEESLAWEPVSTAFGQAVLLHLAIDPADPNRLFVVTSEGAVLASPDAGQSWAPVAG